MAAHIDGLVKRSMRIAGHRTSVALEPIFWTHIAALADARGTTVPQLIAAVDQDRAQNSPSSSLASALRVAALVAKETHELTLKA